MLTKEIPTSRCTELESPVRERRGQRFRTQDQQKLHLYLTELNRRRLAPATPSHAWQQELWETAELAIQEGTFLERERRRIRALAADVPDDAHEFAAWFDGLRETGPGQFDPLFDFLAESASYEEMQWFVRQEVAGEAGFDDLVALTQLRMPQQAKLELARNYWDEMGRGKARGMHGALLKRVAVALDVCDTPNEEIVWESLALANLLTGLAYNRRYAYHAIGGLGVVELTAPTRASKVAEGLDRLDVAREASYYFRLHSTVDIAHARTWRDEVLIPIVSAQPDAAIPIAEGALMRLNAGARTFDRYRREFGMFTSDAFLD